MRKSGGEALRTATRSGRLERLDRPAQRALERSLDRGADRAPERSAERAVDRSDGRASGGSKLLLLPVDPEPLRGESMTAAGPMAAVNPPATGKASMKATGGAASDKKLAASRRRAPAEEAAESRSLLPLGDDPDLQTGLYDGLSDEGGEPASLDDRAVAGGNEPDVATHAMPVMAAAPTPITPAGAPIPSGASGADSHFGSMLRRARERRGLSVAEVADKTRISARWIGALEDAQLDVLPAPVFVSGYLRSYARLVGLDGMDVLERYKDHARKRGQGLPPSERGLAVREHGQKFLHAAPPWLWALLLFAIGVGALAYLWLSRRGALP